MIITLKKSYQQDPMQWIKNKFNRQKQDEVGVVIPEQYVITQNINYQIDALLNNYYYYTIWIPRFEFESNSCICRLQLKVDNINKQEQINQIFNLPNKYKNEQTLIQFKPLQTGKLNDLINDINTIKQYERNNI